MSIISNPRVTIVRKHPKHVANNRGTVLRRYPTGTPETRESNRPDKIRITRRSTRQRGGEAHSKRGSWSTSQDLCSLRESPRLAHHEGVAVLSPHLRRLAQTEKSRAWHCHLWSSGSRCQQHYP